MKKVKAGLVVHLVETVANVARAVLLLLVLITKQKSRCFILFLDFSVVNHKSKVGTDGQLSFSL